MNVATKACAGENEQYDVIIVGGRPAGSTLAARLGQQGMRVLLLERATFPSRPAASCPAIYSSTMRLLDEIGADETDYARGTPRLGRWITEVRDDFRTFNPIPMLHGRDYGYAIDRARFDDALWRNAGRFANVTACQGFAVTELLWSEGRVAGVRGRGADGTETSYRAGCVVGADGRFSIVARKAGAEVRDENAAYPTTLYYAYWKNVEPYDNHGPAVHVFGPGYGYGILLMDSADGTLCAAVEGQSAILDAGDLKPAELYLRLLQQHKQVWRRFRNAEQITGVHGMRNIGNLYRAAGGPGWVLVGDAVHQKDPLDGQGIFDAVFTAKMLAQALGAWHRGEESWERAIAGYEAAVRAETYPMYLHTLERVKRDVYGKTPEWTFRTVLRWLLDDPEYKRRIGLLLLRGIDPKRWLSPSVVLRAFIRGAWRDMRQIFTRGPVQRLRRQVSGGRE